jgi:hypothetical protein
LVSYPQTPETFLKNAKKTLVVPLMDFNANNFHNNDHYMTNANLYATSMRCCGVDVVVVVVVVGFSASSDVQAWVVASPLILT